MNAFGDAMLVEERGMDIVVPWLKARSFKGQVVVTVKGQIARRLQSTVGDILLNSDARTVHGIELKVEQEDAHGNFFLETWSNRNTRTPNPGWLYTLKTDRLFYYFLASDDLYCIDLPLLRRWCFIEPSRNTPGGAGRIFDFPERVQAKRAQMNQTAGRCVPIDVIRSEVGFKQYNPQAEIDPELAAIFDAA